MKNLKNGANQLPEDQQKSLLQHIYSELVRVGERLSQGMSRSVGGVCGNYQTPGAVDDFLAKHFQLSVKPQRNVKLQVCQLMIRV